MTRIDVPSELRGQPTGETIAEGPFVAVHNGEQELLCDLAENGDVLTIWNGSRLFVFDDSFEIETDDSSISLRSTQYGSYWDLYAVQLVDASWALPEFDGDTVEELREDILVMLRQG